MKNLLLVIATIGSSLFADIPANAYRCTATTDKLAAVEFAKAKVQERLDNPTDFHSGFLRAPVGLVKVTIGEISSRDNADCSALWTSHAFGTMTQVSEPIDLGCGVIFHFGRDGEGNAKPGLNLRNFARIASLLRDEMSGFTPQGELLRIPICAKLAN